MCCNGKSVTWKSSKNSGGLHVLKNDNTHTGGMVQPNEHHEQVVAIMCFILPRFCEMIFIWFVNVCIYDQENSSNTQHSEWEGDLWTRPLKICETAVCSRVWLLCTVFR